MYIRRNFTTAVSLGRIENIKKFLAERPQDPFLLFAMAKELEKAEQLEDASVYYLKVIDVDPNYVGAYYHLGQLYILLEEYELADQQVKIGIERADDLKQHKDRSELMQLAQEINTMKA